MDRIDPFRFVRFTQIFGRITLTWPPHPKTTPPVLVIHNLLWNICLFSNIMCLVCVFLKIRCLEDDPVAMSKSISIIAIIGDSCLHLILFRIQWPRLQILVHETVNFLRTAKDAEKRVCRKYIKRYFSSHIFLYGGYAAATVVFAFAPLTLKKRFPLDGWYPFSTDPMFNRIGIYIIQYIAILQVPPCLLSGDCLAFTLLWYASARLELLGLDFRKVDDAFHLRNCARKHQELISFVKEIERAVRLLLLKNLFTVSVTIVCAGVPLSHHRSLTVLSQFFLVVCIASVRLLAFTSAGDDLTEMGTNIAWSIYQSPAIIHSPHLRKGLTIVIHRSQRTMVIAMWVKSLELSLEFYTTYVLRTMSFFMTLRAVVDRYV